MVLDVWLDLSGAARLGHGGPGRPGRRSTPAAAVAVAVPVAIAIARHVLARAPPAGLAREAREATARVTGFIGDTFGGVLAVKAGGAEAAVRRRFAELNAQRARVGRRDQVGSELVRSLGYGTGEVAAGVGPRGRRRRRSAAATCGSATSGCSSTYAAMIAELPKWIGRYLGASSARPTCRSTGWPSCCPSPTAPQVVAPTTTSCATARPPLGPPSPRPGRRRRTSTRARRRRPRRCATPGRAAGVDAASTSSSGGASWWWSPARSGRARPRCCGPCSGLVGTDGGTIRWNGAAGRRPVDGARPAPGRLPAAGAAPVQRAAGRHRAARRAGRRPRRRRSG